ncbi:dihydroneopterin triphosphate diphosphatase [Mergibacter septicus]|uniref:Dihydroneopterin triphosphate diphosphatase n=1 Tax=Mergibacter septicus TaxID=221402 RepID=A0A8E3SCQ6_9PAST|nr:dihydroneopterin triphosphate diphosphatase [Mergibacter septicus]AWX16282.1 dihydroneopterin triphosphate diphosphatase [Mergibacter septicus]QDJ14301.1 dihydroneopterin triphosphate diphosphatase [Mergibacter septicus]UTU48895.1 dihydroneopterin triphosphate diphosphatase [Mergibacter septicus]WMR96803.1 dihydroneopterin triphosphate diphosphatase [Mergibacter septicus]
MKYKRPESVLVVVYCTTSERVLMLRRKDDQDFWQSVSGSLEEGETPFQAAKREVWEELGIRLDEQQGQLYDCQQEVDFEIFPQFYHRYAPGTRYCHEYWFTLAFTDEITVHLTEHTDYQWVEAEQAMRLTKSWNNAAAIEKFILKKKTTQN